MRADNDTFLKNKTLSELLDGIAEIDDGHNHIVSGLAMDTRVMSSGDVFFALGGERFSTLAIVESALKRDPAVVLVDTAEFHKVLSSLKSSEAKLVAVDQLRFKVSEIFHRFYESKISDMSLLGVTGTNGKTSVTYFSAQLREMLSAKQQGIIGTLGTGILGALKETTHTTPSLSRVYQLLENMQSSGVSGVNIEVSSHAMDQGRLGRIDFDYCVFTNLSRDHLDYHGTMEAYAIAKKSLFLQNPKATAIINVDDKVGQEIHSQLTSEKARYVISFGVNSGEADLTVKNLKYDLSGFSGELYYQQEVASFESQLVGEFNVSNLLAAVAVSLAEGSSLAEVAPHISSIKSVPGRMEKVVCTTYKKQGSIEGSLSQTPMVLVDYAHTPDALENALWALKQHTKSQLWCVFGCGGDRDKGKRPMMGAIAEKTADRVVVTSDNPRSEEPSEIIEDVVQGMSTDSSILVEVEREKAIHLAVAKAEAGDVLLIAGKGHEQYQEIKGRKLPFSDQKIAEEALSLRVAS